MSSDPEFRVLLIYLVLLRGGVGLYFHRRHPPLAASSTLLSNPKTRMAKRLAWLLMLLPLPLYATVPDVGLLGDLDLPNALRWLALIPAVASILLVIWSLHLASGPEEFTDWDGDPSRLFQSQPYRLVRHPVESGDVALLLSMGVISGRALICLHALAALAIVYLIVLPLRDAELAQVLGDKYAEYARRSGRVFPRMPKLRGAQYQVPSRFGLTAIIGLLTVLSLVFGGLNLLRFYLEIPATVYFFAAAQVLGICIAQMFFGSAPRMISVLVGAVLLPIFILSSLDLRGATFAILSILVVVCGLFGALVGYCTGTLAAGFFLVMEWLEPILVVRNSRRALSTPGRAPSPLRVEPNATSGPNEAQESH